MPVLHARQRSIGRNEAHLVALHPEMIDHVFPLEPLPRSLRLLRLSRLRRPQSFMVLARVAMGFTRAVGGWSPRIAIASEHFASAAAHAAGLVEGDPSGALLERILHTRSKRG
jgi:hypothetical protein